VEQDGGDCNRIQQGADRFACTYQGPARPLRKGMKQEIKTYRRKYSDRVYFPSALIQYLTWKEFGVGSRKMNPQGVGALPRGRNVSGSELEFKSRW